MPRFAYTALNAAGQRVLGAEDAVSEAALESQLSPRGLALVRAQPQRFVLPRQNPRLPLRERIHFCFQLEQLLSAGIPLIEALTELRDSASHVRTAAVLAELIARIEAGANFSDALRTQGAAFDASACALVRAGESSGHLPEVLSRLAEALRREESLRAGLRKLAIYPGFVLVTALAALLVAMLGVVPEIEKIFRSSQLTLPWATRALIVGADLLAHGWPALVLGVPTLGVAGAILVRRNPALLRQRDALLLALPITGPILHKILLARITNLFALLHAAGLPLHDTLKLVSEASGNAVLRAALIHANEAIQTGHGLGAAFSVADVFPPLLRRMIRVGEQTGAIDRAMQNLTRIYERDVQEAIDTLQASLEPVLTLILGALMGWVALAILGPVHTLVTRMPV
ncbi:MAG: type II secretion system F family protein [Candidatus Dactylopiibacterium sp.]|nr:type II secretion system F family protein [Candidatus Dactylopiibacterium sp.]